MGTWCTESIKKQREQRQIKEDADYYENECDALKRVVRSLKGKVAYWKRKANS